MREKIENPYESTIQLFLLFAFSFDLLRYSVSSRAKYNKNVLEIFQGKTPFYDPYMRESIDFVGCCS